MLLRSFNQNKFPDIDNLDKQLSNIHSWLSLSRLGRKSPLNFKESKKTYITKVRPFPKSVLRTIMLPAKRGFNAKQLLGIMGAPLKIVESDTLSAPFNLERVLIGSVATAHKYKQKVRIIRLVHKEHNSSPDYSLAIFMPTYTWISNWSSWWVFFDLYRDIERFEDTDTTKMREIVQSILSRLKEDIEIKDYPISKEDLLSIAEEPGYFYLKNELTAAKNVNWNIRGALPELLAATYFGTLNSSPIQVDIKPRFLGGKELDVVGVEWIKDRPSTFHIVELKGTYVQSDKELESQLDKFSEKISIVQKNRKELANILGLKIAPRKVRAIFISMANLNHLRLKQYRYIELWSFDDFAGKLNQNKIPTWHINLLRRSSVALTIAFGEDIHKSIFNDK